MPTGPVAIGRPPWFVYDSGSTDCGLPVLVAAGIYVPRSSWDATRKSTRLQRPLLKPLHGRQHTESDSGRSGFAEPRMRPRRGGSPSLIRANAGIFHEHEPEYCKRLTPPAEAAASVDSTNAIQSHEIATPPAAAMKEKSGGGFSISAGKIEACVHQKSFSVQNSGMPGETNLASSQSNQQALFIRRWRFRSAGTNWRKTIDQNLHPSDGGQTAVLDSSTTATGDKRFTGLRGDMAAKTGPSLKSNFGERQKEALSKTRGPRREPKKLRRFLPTADAEVLETLSGTLSGRGKHPATD